MRRIVMLGFVILNIGCATMSDVIRNKSNGVVHVYQVSENDAYKIARRVFLWEGSNAVEEIRDEHLLLTSAVGPFTWGTFMGAWVEPLDANTSKITVLTKRKLQTNIITDLTEETFHERFSQGLAILKSEEPLPIDAPY